MSRRKNRYDCAVAASFFSTVKSEEGARLHSFSHAEVALLGDIEAF